jgi:hypothetical protein
MIIETNIKNPYYTFWVRVLMVVYLIKKEAVKWSASTSFIFYPITF